MYFFHHLYLVAVLFFCLRVESPINFLRIMWDKIVSFVPFLNSLFLYSRSLLTITVSTKGVILLDFDLIPNSESLPAIGGK